MSIVPVGADFELLVNEFAEPPEVPSAKPLDIFNTVAFHRLHTIGNHHGYYFQVRKRRNGRIVATAHFTRDDGDHWKSPLRGSYGGFEIDNRLDLKEIEVFLGAIERNLSEAGAKTLTVVLPPTVYNPSRAAILHNVLWRSGYSNVRHELNYSLPVSKDPYDTHLDLKKLQRVRRCRREGVTARRFIEETEQRSAYDVICENRISRGYPITMNWNAVQEMTRTFPNQILYVGAMQAEQMIAAAICVRINPFVLYGFYWGDRPGYESLSPVAFLVGHLYEYAQAESITLLDGGTSSVDGVPNHGLVRYKRDLGMTESLKWTMMKVL